jgi:type II secretory pathway pseudopilin PulG
MSKSMTDQRGFTVIELLVSIAAFIVVLGAILTMTSVATHKQDEIAKRVAVNQRARPILTRVMDYLHSACVAPRVAPVLTGTTASPAPSSTSDSITFLSRSGNQVAPIPNKYRVFLSGGTLSETVYPGTGGTGPTSWTYGSPVTRTLLTNVRTVSGTPLFQYFKYNGSALSSALPTPLSSTDASLTVQVDVTFTVDPSGGVSALDPNSPLTLSDSATFRLESPSNSSGAVNSPCA